MVTSTSGLAEPAPLPLGEGVVTAGTEVDVLPQSTSNAAYVDLPPKSLLLMLPFGEGVDGQAFDLWVTGWRAFRKTANDHGGYWVPVILAKLTCTLGNALGPFVFMNNLTNARGCDTVTLVESRVLDPPSVQVLAAGTPDNTQATVAMDTMGYSVIGFHVMKTTANGNLLWSVL